MVASIFYKNCNFNQQTNISRSLIAGRESCSTKPPTRTTFRRAGCTGHGTWILSVFIGFLGSVVDTERPRGNYNDFYRKRIITIITTRTSCFKVQNDPRLTVARQRITSVLSQLWIVCGSGPCRLRTLCGRCKARWFVRDSKVSTQI